MFRFFNIPLLEQEAAGFVKCLAPVQPKRGGLDKGFQCRDGLLWIASGRLALGAVELGGFGVDGASVFLGQRVVLRDGFLVFLVEMRGAGIAVVGKAFAVCLDLVLALGMAQACLDGRAVRLLPRVGSGHDRSQHLLHAFLCLLAGVIRVAIGQGGLVLFDSHFPFGCDAVHIGIGGKNTCALMALRLFLGVVQCLDGFADAGVGRQAAGTFEVGRENGFLEFFGGKAAVGFQDGDGFGGLAVGAQMLRQQDGGGYGLGGVARLHVAAERVNAPAGRGGVGEVFAGIVEGGCGDGLGEGEKDAGGVKKEARCEAAYARMPPKGGTTNEGE